MIKNIVFDMGQVLMHFTPEEYIGQIGVLQEDRVRLLDEVFKHVEWVQLDRGSISEEAAVAAICKRLPNHLHHCVEKLVFDWWKHPIIPVEGMEALVAELKRKGYGIYLLSNASRQLPKYFDTIPGSQYFDGRIVSADWGLVKPERKLYQILLKTYGLEAGECFFIDDVPMNIEAAYCVGMAGTVFTGDVARLRRELREAGVDCGALNVQ